MYRSEHMSMLHEIARAVNRVKDIGVVEMIEKTYEPKRHIAYRKKKGK